MPGLARPDAAESGRGELFVKCHYDCTGVLIGFPLSLKTSPLLFMGMTSESVTCAHTHSHTGTHTETLLFRYRHTQKIANVQIYFLTYFYIHFLHLHMHIRKRPQTHIQIKSSQGVCKWCIFFKMNLWAINFIMHNQGLLIKSIKFIFLYFFIRLYKCFQG